VSHFVRHSSTQSSPAELTDARDRASPILSDCDICGSTDLAEIRCKVICRNCRTILQSCADL
jgi:hypothetical protein